MSQAVIERESSGNWRDSWSQLRIYTVVAFVLAFFMPPAGLILNIISYRLNAKDGGKSLMALWGMIISVVLLIVAFISAYMLYQAVMGIATDFARDGVINMDAICAHADRWSGLVKQLNYTCPAPTGN